MNKLKEKKRTGLKKETERQTLRMIQLLIWKEYHSRFGSLAVSKTDQFSLEELESLPVLDPIREEFRGVLLFQLEANLGLHPLVSAGVTINELYLFIDEVAKLATEIKGKSNSPLLKKHDDAEEILMRTRRLLSVLPNDKQRRLELESLVSPPDYEFFELIESYLRALEVKIQKALEDRLVKGQKRKSSKGIAGPLLKSIDELVKIAFSNYEISRQALVLNIANLSLMARFGGYEGQEVNPRDYHCHCRKLKN